MMQEDSSIIIVDEYTLLQAELRALNIIVEDKFNPKAEIPVELLQRCFVATARCQSTNVKDRIYWIMHDMHDYPTCQHCGKQIITEIKSFKSTLYKQRHCSSSCRLKDPIERKRHDDARFERTGFRHQQQDPKVREKLKQTCLTRYGVDNVLKHQPIFEKVKQTLLKNYGVENISKHPDTTAKRQETCLKRFGVRHPLQAPWIKEKAAQTCFNRYGKRNPNQVPEFQLKLKQTNLSKYGSEHPAHTEKGRITCFKRYGVSHPMQSFKVFQKVLRSRFKLKKLELNGAVFTYQGFEDVLIKHLLTELKLDHRDLIIGRKLVPKVFYYNTAKHKKACYYPDIFVKSQNLLIEVKSEFTLKLDTQALNKQHACKQAGYEHIIAVCDKKKILYII